MPSSAQSHAETPVCHVMAASVRLGRDGNRALLIRTEHGPQLLVVAPGLAAQIGRGFLGLAMEPERHAQPAAPAVPPAPAPRGRASRIATPCLAIRAARIAQPLAPVAQLCAQHGIEPQRYYAFESYRRGMGDPAAPARGPRGERAPIKKPSGGLL